ncbi:hypothetical protein RchiOBHm_Chr1g0316741 [Rosa chinensis]|uniref:Uncharacterized protein n=1 Tax=Rosa chinensis TaxID=74649 RepID=A0A2P6S7U4_ROSCH|nr:hypothetical protein RchiOBHm_Chr1g0316741 [Rosa chinensis]
MGRGCQTLFDFVNNQVGVGVFFIFQIVVCLSSFFFLFWPFGSTQLKKINFYDHVTFLIVQKDGTYMFNLDSMIPKLCQIAQEMREDGTAMNLRAAGLQALSSMVIYQHSLFVITSCCDPCFAYVIKILIILTLLPTYESFVGNVIHK